MILSAGAREVRGEGVGCWAGLDERWTLVVFLGLGATGGSGGGKFRGSDFLQVEWQPAGDVRARLLIGYRWRFFGIGFWPGTGTGWE